MDRRPTTCHHMATLAETVRIVGWVVVLHYRCPTI
jgi:hypothetical protein